MLTVSDAMILGVLVAIISGFTNTHAYAQDYDIAILNGRDHGSRKRA